ncbi:hypothetical protein FVEN_g13015 [Fusarium venenatum]|nr:hypothetical protein FVEN_g13015 [Fusarium venenatum]
MDAKTWGSSVLNQSEEDQSEESTLVKAVIGANNSSCQGELPCLYELQDALPLYTIDDERNERVSTHSGLSAYSSTYK